MNTDNNKTQNEMWWDAFLAFRSINQPLDVASANADEAVRHYVEKFTNLTYKGTQYFKAK